MTYYLIVRVGLARETTDVKRAITRSLSFLNVERKNGYFEARTGNRCDKSAKGRRFSSSFTYRLWERLIFTVFALSARELNRPVCSVLVICSLKGLC